MALKYNSIITVFSDQKYEQLKGVNSYPHIILFNLSSRSDFNFLSSSVVQHFSEASVILLTDPILQKEILTVPVFRKVQLLYKPAPISFIYNSIEQALEDLVISNENEISLGNGYINMRNRTIRSHSGSRAYLTDKEFLMVKLLYEASPRILKKSELLKKIWGYSDNIKTRTLETHIYRLRQKFAEILDNNKIIIYENGGYKIV